MTTKWMLGAVAAGLALGAAACGSSVGGGGGSGGAGGTGGGTTGSGGEGGVIPPECAVETSSPGPYAVTFQFENFGINTVYLREECALQYSITSCADGYSEPVDTRIFCSQPCGDPEGGCIVCGPCLLAGMPVQVGAQTTDEWLGTRYTSGTNASGCSCHEEHAAPAGRYRIEVPVYTTEMAAMEGTPSYNVTVNFELPAPNGVVVVPIGMSP